MNPGLFAGFGGVPEGAWPIGSVIQSPINLETATNGQWIALDGRDCNRSDYPLLAPYFPAGVFTSTARTLGAAPNAAVIAADATNFVAASTASGSALIQASADGVTWTNGSGWTTSTASSIIYTPSRFIVAGSGTDLGSPITLPVNGTAANVVAAASRTNTTGGTTTTLTKGLAYSSSLGRTVLCVNGSGSTATKLFYMNDASTTWNACSGGSSCDRKAVIWTGQKFIAFVASPGNWSVMSYQTSSDGITWADAIAPVQLQSGGLYSAASDGNGTVVVVAATYLQNAGSYAMIVSKDHGVTWRTISVGYQGSPSSYPIHYANGKFFVLNNGGSFSHLISADGITWGADQMLFRGGIPFGTSATSGSAQAVAYKAGTYAFITNTTSAFTATEDMSKFCPQPSFGVPSATVDNFATQAQRFIKARN